MASQGATAYTQRNEKQTIYLDSMRGAIGGSFRLFFTDAFGQTWPTSEIHVSELLKGGEGGVSSASVDAVTKSVVTFFPALPAGDLAIGDFIMIADERKEILTVYPEPLAYRPSKSGGVIDSVKLRTDLQAVSSNVPAFRMGPARGVRKALRTIPQGIVTDVTTSTLNDGTLIGYPSGGITSASGKVTMATMKGDYDALLSSTLYGPQAAGPADGGGLAPYDLVRMTNTGGISEYLQVRKRRVGVEAGGGGPPEDAGGLVWELGEITYTLLPCCQLLPSHLRLTTHTRVTRTAPRFIATGRQRRPRTGPRQHINGEAVRFLRW